MLSAESLAILKVNAWTLTLNTLASEAVKARKTLTRGAILVKSCMHAFIRAQNAGCVHTGHVTAALACLLRPQRVRGIDQCRATRWNPRREYRERRCHASCERERAELGRPATG